MALERAKMDNEDLREKNLKTKADILTNENEVSTKEAILKDKLINLNDAKFKVSDLESKISAVKMSIEEKKQIMKTNEDLKKSDNDKEKEAKKKLKELNADIASKKKIASKQLQDVEVKSSKIESSKKEFIEAQERLIKLQSKVDQLKVVLAESEKQVDEMNQIEKENEINKTKEIEIEAKIKAKKKEVTQLKRSLTSSTKNNDKLQKQLDKNTDSYNKVKTELDQLQKKYDENKMKQATLIKDIDDATSKIDEQAKANDANKDNQKLVENVLNEFKAEKAKILNEIENAEKEFKGILICKQRDNDEIYQKLQSELDLSAKELNSKTLEYEMKMAELAKLDVQPEDTSKVHKDIRHLEESIKALETHLVEKKAESKKLDGKLESLKETYCPTPSRLFRSPRALLSGSQAVPSPRKKFAASEPSPVR